MGSKSTIEWTDATWNPVTGCSKVSEGCRHCYAERLSLRKLQPYDTGLPWTAQNAEANVTLHHDRLAIPLRWKKPRRVFVNSMSDLFHEQIPDEFIERVFGVMAIAERHTFQILTKRAERMERFFNAERILQDVTSDVMSAAEMLRPQRVIWDPRGPEANHYQLCASPPRGEALAIRRRWPGWPLPNVHLGVSVEDQATADERIPLLLETPAAVRFVSAEPLLGSIVFESRENDGSRFNWMSGTGVSMRSPCQSIPNSYGNRLDWVIVGGESGPGARPMHPDWVRSIRDQCVEAGVPFFFKQGSQANWPRYKDFESFPPDLQIRVMPHAKR